MTLVSVHLASPSFPPAMVDLFLQSSQCCFYYHSLTHEFISSWNSSSHLMCLENASSHFKSSSNVTSSMKPSRINSYPKSTSNSWLLSSFVLSLILICTWGLTPYIILCNPLLACLLSYYSLSSMRREFIFICYIFSPLTWNITRIQQAIDLWAIRSLLLSTSAMRMHEKKEELKKK